MSSCLLKSPCLLNLQNSGAKYISNKILRQFQNFSVCLSNMLAKKMPKTQLKRLYITSTMALAYLDILARALILFFNSWDYLFCLNYLFIIFPLLIAMFWFSSWILVIVGEHIQCCKTRCLKFSSMWKQK